MRSAVVSLAVVALLFVGASALTTSTTETEVSLSFPIYPFTRYLYVNHTALMTGEDVEILQFLLQRSPAGGYPVNMTGKFDAQTKTALTRYQNFYRLPADGQLNPATADYLMKHQAFDDFTGDSRPARAFGLKFKIEMVSHRNRSIETQARLLDADNNFLYEFRVRTHGHSQFGPEPWPAYKNDVGLNEFTSNGATVSGLMYLDLNTPEPDPKLYGPYDVLRLVTGITGNAQFLLPKYRNGLLIHTGDWKNHGWVPPANMPNSAGCVHAWPEAVKKIAEILKSLGVVANENPFGKVPYPFKPQGLLSHVVLKE